MNLDEVHTIHLDVSKIFFYSENKSQLEEATQGCDWVPFTGGFQGAVGQDATSSHLESFSYDRLD